MRIGAFSLLALSVFFSRSFFLSSHRETKLTHPDPRERNAKETMCVTGLCRKGYLASDRTNRRQTSAFAWQIMGNGLIVKHEVRLSKDDTALLQRIAKAKRCSLASLLREAAMEWLARRSYLEDEEKKALGIGR